MPESKEMKRLTARWSTGAGWPRRLDWIEIGGVRGWQKERIELRYPIMASVGENGAGKSTVLQCIASVYKSKPQKEQGRKRQPKKLIYASDFFPDTAWETIKDATIRYSFRQGGNPPMEGTLRKPEPRWRGYKERPSRQVIFRDLSRIQPITARVGYARLAKPKWSEKNFIPFDKKILKRFSHIMGREYDLAKMSYTDGDANRPVPVIGHDKMSYSGFHQGAGETVLAELLQVEIPQYSILLIDEVESSLHPRLQRRLIRDLAELARAVELQIVITTHSPIILEELPPEARAHTMVNEENRTILYGVAPEFAMTKMDDTPRPECDLYVEDERAERMLLELIIAHATNRECGLPSLAIRYGVASVGQQLGIMVKQERWKTPTFVFLDGDQGESVGCLNLPGQDPPEVIVFENLRAKNWEGLAGRIRRDFALTADACTQAMSLPDHHEWITYASNKLVLSSDALWQAMCSEWATQCVATDDVKNIIQPIEDALDKVLMTFTPPTISITTMTAKKAEYHPQSTVVSNESLRL